MSKRRRRVALPNPHGVPLAAETTDVSTRDDQTEEYVLQKLYVSRTADQAITTLAVQERATNADIIRQFIDAGLESKQTLPRGTKRTAPGK